MEPWQWMEKDKGSQDDEELRPKLIFKERNPRLTPTESCASDDMEEDPH